MVSQRIKTFVGNLRYACATAAQRNILIEPLNRHDAPDYFLQTTDQAIAHYCRSWCTKHQTDV